MARFLKKRDKSRGMVPGSLIFIGNKKMEEIRIRLIDYDKEHLQENELRDIKEGERFRKTDTVTWINIDGLHDTQRIKEIGQSFELHPLLLEDVMNTGQRPKMEEFDNCIFMVLKMLRLDKDSNLIIAEQFSMVLGRTFLITFQEQVGDVFEPVRERIRKQKGRIRGTGVDYLAYALLDTIVDNYIYIIERMGDEIENLEDAVLQNAQPSVMEKINNLRREMNFLRKSVRPAREAIVQLTKLETDFISDQMALFLKDLQDLAIDATEAIDTYREMLSDQLNIYNISISNRMNEIMKILTIFAAIFIPLTFVAGIYGTNFEYLPELHFRYSYFIFWGIMIIIATSMLMFFRKKGWL